MDHFLGLDCGGTKTRAVVFNEREEIVFEGESGPANWASTPRDRFERHVREAIAGAPRCRMAVVGVAGMVGQRASGECEALMRKIVPATELAVMTDYEPMLYAGEGQFDLLAMCGTGSIIASLEGDDVVRSLGRGPLFGDFGSAFAYGREFLHLWMDQPDAVSAAAQREVMVTYGSDNPDDVLASIYGSPSPYATIARFAGSLGREAAKGGPAEAALRGEMEIFVRELVDHLRFVNEKALDAPTVLLAGGLWQSAPIYSQALADEMVRALPKSQPQLIQWEGEPAHQSAMLALSMAT